MLAETDFRVAQTLHDPSTHTHSSIVLGRDSVHGGQAGATQNNVIIDEMDVVGGQFEGHEESEEEGRVPVRGPHMTRNGPLLQGGFVVLELGILKNDDLTHSCVRLVETLHLIVQPCAFEL